MYYGFLLTGVCITALVICCLIEVRRVDRIIERVDRRIGQPEEQQDKK